ncbi:DUF4388 domain-containing protein [Actinomadura madurae]|uniref:DUF4388 domain-containing protein n=1 Tax=Actinomadura madurae TaxID=1993 RepID=UPI002026F1D5|nr:DUF4388 domain-containing protein [Actinomadura madurae]MCP9951652.1 DUF4388 domain-containing protein [Actinomadura madurae]MCP9980896.1 DUF4388 domain-containing protein [Actinomadura madurae]URM97283.1 DUF4388 domain-containing protein [Actinomadura madurae]
MVGNTISDVLGSLERERRTGLLRVGGDGTVHVDRGAVVHAESPHAPGPRPGGADPELPALLALFDAAYFLLGSTAEPVFTEGAPRGRPFRVTVATLVHERRRRRALLDAAWPDAGVDAAPVVPVRRVRRQRVILTGVQAEILLNADGRRAPGRLARDLGRTAFGCLLAVRGLAAASLIRTDPPAVPGPPPPPRAEIPAEWAPADHDLLGRLRAALVELG